MREDMPKLIRRRRPDGRNPYRARPCNADESFADADHAPMWAGRKGNTLDPHDRRYGSDTVIVPRRNISAPLHTSLWKSRAARYRERRVSRETAAEVLGIGADGSWISPDGSSAWAPLGLRPDVAMLGAALILQDAPPAIRRGPRLSPRTRSSIARRPNANQPGFITSFATCLPPADGPSSRDGAASDRRRLAVTLQS
jgi:hypothetical protein